MPATAGTEWVRATLVASCGKIEGHRTPVGGLVLPVPGQHSAVPWHHMTLIHVGNPWEAGFHMSAAFGGHGEVVLACEVEEEPLPGVDHFVVNWNEAVCLHGTEPAAVVTFRHSPSTPAHRRALRSCRRKRVSAEALSSAGWLGCGEEPEGVNQLEHSRTTPAQQRMGQMSSKQNPGTHFTGKKS